MGLKLLRGNGRAQLALQLKQLSQLVETALVHSTTGRVPKRDLLVADVFYYEIDLRTCAQAHHEAL